MRRRDFVKGIVGSVAACPLAALAQQGEHMRRIGVLMNIGADDPNAPYWSEHSLKDWQKRAGSSAAMRGSIIDGIKAPRPLAPTRRNCSR